MLQVPAVRMGDLSFQSYRFPFSPISRLSLVQVEPAKVDLDRVDLERRRDVIDGIFAWLTQRAISPGSVPQPEPPRIIAFPELYCPYRSILDRCEDALQGDQVVVTGLCAPESPRAPFFDATAVEQLLQHPSARRIKNPRYLEGLHRRLRNHGRCANLAVSLVCDSSAERHLVFHSKAIPSKFEKRLRYDDNTIEGSELQILKLIWRTTQQFSILPLICSDFIYRHEGLRTSILALAAQRRKRVDLACVLSIQKCYPAAHPPWPREYQLPTLELAERRFSVDLDSAITMMTNVGSFELHRLPHQGGFSYLSLPNSPGWPPYEAAWSGSAWHFGKFSFTTLVEPTLPPTYAWARHRNSSWYPPGSIQTPIATLLTHEPLSAPEPDALVHHFELSVESSGEGAFHSGRLIAFRVNAPMEEVL